MKRIKEIARPKSLTQSVTEQLRFSIISGELALGQALSEASLAESFGVSKTPVREALFFLKQEGLIEIKPQKGSFVFKPDAATVHELCDYRAYLEPQAMREAMNHNPDALLESLDICMVKMTRRLKAGDFKQYLMLDGEFHAAFVDHCNNRFIQKSYHMVSANIGALRSHLACNESMSESILNDHNAIIEQLEKGDIDLAASVLHRHIIEIKDAYTEVTV